MPFHVVIEGEKRGPFPAFRVIEQLRAGEVSPDALGWEPGMDAWCKLRDIPSFAEAIEILEESPEPEGEETGSMLETSVPTQSGDDAETAVGRELIDGRVSLSDTRPFARFLARTFDYMMISVFTLLFVDVPPAPVAGENFDFMAQFQSFMADPRYLELARLQYVGLILWHGVEGLLLHHFCTTPGKALFGIRITAANGNPLSILEGVGRSFLVFAAGFGLGLFPFNLIGMGIGLSMLMFTGATLWDRKFNIQMSHAPFTPARILMAMGGFFLLMIISSLKFS